MTNKLLLPLLWVCGLVACGAELDELRTRAAIDLRCPEAQVRIRHIGTSSKAVYGCNRHAVYNESCTGQRGSLTTTCSWSLNSQVIQDTAAEIAK